jgi:hypothetical protein
MIPYLSKQVAARLFFLAKFSDLAKRNFKMAKDMCFSCFLVTMFLQFLFFKVLPDFSIGF